MASLIGQGAAAAGADVVRKSVSDASPDEVAGFDVVAFGSPSMGSEMVEESEMAPFVETALPSLKGKKVGLFGSYGWGDGEWMRNWASEMKNAGAALIDDGLITHEKPEGTSADECVAWGGKIAKA
jgi:flavodoxin short chain